MQTKESSCLPDRLRSQADAQALELLRRYRIIHNLPDKPLRTALFIRSTHYVYLTIAPHYGIPSICPPLLLSLPFCQFVLMDQSPLLRSWIGQHLSLCLVRKILPATLVHER